MLTPSEMKDRMHELARNEGNIAGIYNYCDRWCEHGFLQTYRCMFLLMEKMTDHEDEILKFLISLADIRKQTELTFPMARKFVRPGFDD